jgi:hypothetical protein
MFGEITGAGTEHGIHAIDLVRSPCCEYTQTEALSGPFGDLRIDTERISPLVGRSTRVFQLNPTATDRRSTECPSGLQDARRERSNG